MTTDPETSITPKDPNFKSKITLTTYSSWADEVEAAQLAELQAKSSVQVKKRKLADE
jgi:hypothetical protein